LYFASRQKRFPAIFDGCCGNFLTTEGTEFRGRSFNEKTHAEARRRRGFLIKSLSAPLRLCVSLSIKIFPPDSVPSVSSVVKKFPQQPSKIAGNHLSLPLSAAPPGEERRKRKRKENEEGRGLGLKCPPKKAVATRPCPRLGAAWKI
jgi:hypothetical protein